MANPLCSPIRIHDIPLLSQSHCKIKNEQNVEKILNEFIAGGPKKLQLLIDFDHTITKQKRDDGKPVLSSFAIFGRCKSLPEKYVKESNELNKKYRPIEIDPKIPIEEKIKHMEDWWRLSGDLLVGFPFDQKEIDEVTYEFKDALRDRTEEMFNDLHKVNVPILVFSAGLGNSVISLLKQANLMLPNIKIVSNFLQYDENGLLNGFKVPLIHSFNKNETALNGTEYYDLVQDRDHIILMGDSLGDAGMAEGVPSSSHILKIGFLFDHVDENLNRYMDTFDIVLIDDQTMDIPKAFIDLINNTQNIC